MYPDMAIRYEYLGITSLVISNNMSNCKAAKGCFYVFVDFQYCMRVQLDQERANIIEITSERITPGSGLPVHSHHAYMRHGSTRLFSLIIEVRRKCAMP